ncbi:hypothetical protein [Chitinophaga sp. CF418]|uniref:hypothetical protein n=1 Tax=Chitinophaga sp. CF418 TaxID=1855287 RepID=UPI000919A176|nr:hypothetical protein [Chitinophaga sp. CF418]SHN44043.1 hypothetical protein SAMN05216311_116185 [Chitinophaga sp. CF418]
MQDRIKTLDRYLTEEVLHNSNEHETKIITLISEISQEFISSYDIQKKWGSELFQVYEKHGIKSVAHLSSCQGFLYNKLQSLEIERLNLSFWIGELDTNEQFKIVQKAIAKMGQSGISKYRISDFIDLQLTISERKEIGSLLIKCLNLHNGQFRLSDNEIESFFIQLSIVRNICITEKKEDSFYVLLDSYIDLLYRAGDYQLSRGIAEDALVCGYFDHKIDLGYNLAFKVYASTGAAAQALHYSICAMTSAITKGKISDYWYQILISQTMKLYRNCKIYSLAIDIYRNRPKNWALNEHALTYIYFTCLLGNEEALLPSTVVDYLNKHREEIIPSGVPNIMQWITLLYNIIHYYPTSHTGIEESKMYISVFEKIVGPDNAIGIKDIFEGTIEKLSQRLKTSLTDLSATITGVDFATDNTHARFISDQLIVKSFKVRNPEEYLLCMIVNADFTICFKNTTINATLPLWNRKKNFEEVYYSFENIKHYFKSLDNHTILWLGTNKVEVLPMTCQNEMFLFHQDAIFTISAINNWYEANINTLPFVEYKRLISGGNAHKTEEELISEEILLAADLQSTSIDIQSIERLLIIKDYELARFPHNLLINKSGQFISSLIPTFNILSTEWIMGRSNQTLPKKYSKSIWIPTDSGDMALNYLYSYIEDTINTHKFDIATTKVPSKQLQSDLNIVAAHGSEDINTFPAFHAKSEEGRLSIVDIKGVIGSGKILILFVCHSGSMRSDFLRNRVATLVREALQSGYEAVIAPFWALNISIVKFWLPAFLESFDSGKELIDAVYDGNTAVKNEYPTPKAYACLHAYGNPFFRVH